MSKSPQRPIKPENDTSRTLLGTVAVVCMLAFIIFAMGFSGSGNTVTHVNDGVAPTSDAPPPPK